MKIAISGKGGVGKTLLASFLSKIFADSGYSVLAIDADSNATLAATLGFPNAQEITPISEMKELIEERTGATPGKSGTYFRLNPKVDDLPEKFWREHRGIKLMVMGELKRGSSGCYCPENAMLQALVSHLLLARNEVIIMDMEAGIEHLGRATAKAVDELIIVVEPARRSIETANKIRQLAGDMGLQNISIVGNKIRSQTEKEFLTSSLADFKFLGFIPYESALTEADIAGVSIIDSSPKVMAAVKDIYKALTSGAKIEAKK
ncbi:MAG: carbon monoxide dehydrogenase accessory protein CooC [Chloroflexota bacterium]